MINYRNRITRASSITISLLMHDPMTNDPPQRLYHVPLYCRRKMCLFSCPQPTPKIIIFKDLQFSDRYKSVLIVFTEIDLLKYFLATYLYFKITFPFMSIDTFYIEMLLYFLYWDVFILRCLVFYAKCNNTLPDIL